MTIRHLLIARSPILLPHVGAHELDDSSDNPDSRHMVDEETARTKILQDTFPTLLEQQVQVLGFDSCA
jgi:hypothetical protein